MYYTKIRKEGFTLEGSLSKNKNRVRIVSCTVFHPPVIVSDRSLSLFCLYLGSFISNLKWKRDEDCHYEWFSMSSKKHLIRSYLNPKFFSEGFPFPTYEKWLSYTINIVLPIFNNYYNDLGKIFTSNWSWSFKCNMSS